MAEYKSSYTGEQIDAGIAKANEAYLKPIGGIPKTDLSDGVQTSLGKADTAIQDISGKQDTLISGTNIKTINNTSILGEGNISVSGSINVREVDCSDPTQFNDGEPTVAVLNDIATHEYQALRIYNIPFDEDITLELWYFIIAMLHAESTQLRKYARCSDDSDNYDAIMAVMTISKSGSEDATMTEAEYPLGTANN